MMAFARNFYRRQFLDFVLLSTFFELFYDSDVNTYPQVTTLILFYLDVSFTEDICRIPRISLTRNEEIFLNLILKMEICQNLC